MLLDNSRRVLETRITDKEGRYGFLTTPESLTAQHIDIQIVPQASNYIFPSREMPTIDTFIYGNIYRGGIVTVNEQTPINFDIPMDPLRQPSASFVTTSPSITFGASVAAFADAGFWLGIIMVPINFILSPTPFSFGVLMLFIGTSSLRIFGIGQRPYGVVIDMHTGRPVPFALITLNTLTGQRKGFTVSDEYGRYFIITERGHYEISVFTPAAVMSQRKTSTIINTGKGWITRKLIL
jgi:hypothetical protein